eukprot:882336-Alexandrium_andersonii.AAC.1
MPVARRRARPWVGPASGATPDPLPWAGGYLWRDAALARGLSLPPAQRWVFSPGQEVACGATLRSP